jgi:hypothetical protein
MKKNYFLILIVLVFFSCQKEISTEVSNTNTNTQVDVYVAGYEVNGSGVGVAKYWKNGQAIALTDGTKNAWASSIVVVGSDVYVAGSEVTADRNSVIAKYWKNGILIALNDASKRGYASCIAVSGSDVYVAGYLNNPNTPGDYGPHAVYWKNGNLTYLPENTRPVENGYWNNYPISSATSLANSIFISGSDVYIAGQEHISRVHLPDPNDPFGAPSGIDAISALYWKNGKAVYLIMGPYGGSHADEANSIFVLGQDVYACGALDAQYWKNGTSFSLPASDAKSIFVSNGDVYVAGYLNDGEPVQGYFGTYYKAVAKYWKNGTEVRLSDGTKDAYATSIAVVGSDVYVAGTVYNGTSVNGSPNGIATYWKNGQTIALTDGTKTAEVSGLVVIKR